VLLESVQTFADVLDGAIIRSRNLQCKPVECADYPEEYLTDDDLLVRHLS